MTWPRSLRARLTLWYTAVLAAMLTLFAVGSFLLVRRVLTDRMDQFLDASREMFIAELRAEHLEEPELAAAVRVAFAEFRFRDVRFIALGPRGEVLDTSEVIVAKKPPSGGGAESVEISLGRIAAELRADPGRVGRPFTIADDEGGARVLASQMQLASDTLLVAAVQSMHELHESLETVALAFALGIPLLLLLASGAGSWLARTSLAPVGAMGHRAAAITASNLDERLPVGIASDELSGLATVINGLLQRLQHAFELQRRFMADASHELRTPVAIVRSEADIALARDERSNLEYRDAMAVIRGAAVRLSRIVHDLFLLARADSGLPALQKNPLYLDDVIENVVQSLRSLAAERGVALTFRNEVGDAPFEGDEELLQRVITNLADNAVKFSRHGGAVSLTLNGDVDGYQLRVQDEGPGIPTDAQAHVFERFYRADVARTTSGASETSGAGLGLSIARWIADAHDGTLELAHSSERGSLFILRLPWRT